MKNLKTLVIGALIGLAIWALIPLFGPVGAENDYKFDQTGNYVALYPSVWKCMLIMSPVWWVLSIVISIVGGAFAAFKKDDAVAGQKVVPTVGIGILTVVLSWGLMFLPAGSQKDFTHKTIQKSEFVKEAADHGKYDSLFHKFNQVDELYNSPAVFANPQ